MFPVILDLTDWPVAVVGDSGPAERRLALVDAAGAAQVTVFAPDPSPAMRDAAGDRLVMRLPTDAEVAGFRVVFTADLPDAEAERIAHVARDHRVILNTEDDRPRCDFHVPAMVRRGDLLLTISTNGKSPGLARALRLDMEARFGPEWAGRLEEIARARDAWRAEGASFKDLIQRTEALIAQKGWLS